MFKLNRATYLALCIFLCFLPALAIFIVSTLSSFASDFPEFGLNFSMIPKEYLPLVNMLNQFLMTVLTYPAGAIGAIVSLITIYFGILTPEEAFLLTTPLYIAAGYIQWYVVMPKYFKEKNLNSPLL
jgi:hypothetical protein